MRKFFFFFVTVSLLIIYQPSFSQKLTANEELGRSVFKELIEINTTLSSGNTTIAAKAMAKRFLDAGFSEKDVVVIGPRERNQNIVIRIHGSGKAKPVLFLSHLDVVEALRGDWSMDPFQLNERDGYFYGRGTCDIKDGDAILVADFIRLKKENFIPDRDLILALTAGEEDAGDYNGVEWLLKTHRELIDAAYCINMDAGDPQLKNGKRTTRSVQTSEKTYLDINLEVKNPGGHSSEPSKENAIYHLADGLVKLREYNFPAQINETTRIYFGKMSEFESGQTAADMKAVSKDPNDKDAIARLSMSPYYNALIRTTCVATMLSGGHAPNALPQTAKANINCRVMPGTSQQEVLNAISDVLGDKQIEVTVGSAMHNNPASPLNPEVMQKIEAVTNKLWPGAIVIPTMDVGASDGIYLRSEGIPTYGVSGVCLDMDDNRAHGKDERIFVKSYYDGLEYEYNLIKAIGSVAK
jgi:acetylornithine deacetylase/succinyl-diaminopimelate desuccinylase-like protein